MINTNWTAEDEAGNHLVITNVQRSLIAHSWTITVDGRKWRRACASHYKNKRLMRRLRAMAACLLICYMASAQADTLYPKIDTTMKHTADDTLFVCRNCIIEAYHPPGNDTIPAMIMASRSDKNVAYYPVTFRGYHVVSNWGNHITFLDKWKKPLKPYYLVWEWRAAPRRSKSR